MSSEEKTHYKHFQLVHFFTLSIPVPEETTGAYS